jgi:hypothetical protein
MPSTRSKCWWKCPEGHSFDLPPNLRIRRQLALNQRQIARLIEDHHVSWADSTRELTAGNGPVRDTGDERRTLRDDLLQRRLALVPVDRGLAPVAARRANQDDYDVTLFDGHSPFATSTEHCQLRVRVCVPLVRGVVSICVDV